MRASPWRALQKLPMMPITPILQVICKPGTRKSRMCDLLEITPETALLLGFKPSIKKTYYLYCYMKRIQVRIPTVLSYALTKEVRITYAENINATSRNW